MPPTKHAARIENVDLGFRRFREISCLRWAGQNLLRLSYPKRSANASAIFGCTEMNRFIPELFSPHSVARGV